MDKSICVTHDYGANYTIKANKVAHVSIWVIPIQDCSKLLTRMWTTLKTYDKKDSNTINPMHCLLFFIMTYELYLNLIVWFSCMYMTGLAIFLLWPCPRLYVSKATISLSLFINYHVMLANYLWNRVKKTITGIDLRILLTTYINFECGFAANGRCPLNGTVVFAHLIDELW